MSPRCRGDRSARVGGQGGQGGGGEAAPYSSLNTLFAYDPKTDIWTVKAAMPTARTDLAACAVDGLMYVIGGIIAAGSYPSLVECYDPRTEQWTRKRDLLDVAPACAAQAVNGIIYVFSFQSTFAYDRENDRWNRVASMPGVFESINSMAGVVDGVAICPAASPPTARTAPRRSRLPTT